MNVVLSISIVFPLFALHKSVSTRVSTFRLNSSIIEDAFFPRIITVAVVRSTGSHFALRPLSKY